MHKYYLFSLGLILLFTGACSGKKIIPAPTSQVLGGVITVNADWVKDKSKKYDLKLAITNEYKEPIIVLLSEMRCYRGNVRGDLRHTFFNTGERTIDFRKGQRKSFNLVCSFGSDQEGDFKIAIGNVYSNPSGDGRTMGPAVSKDLVWVLAHNEDD